MSNYTTVKVNAVFRIPESFPIDRFREIFESGWDLTGYETSEGYNPPVDLKDANWVDITLEDGGWTWEDDMLDEAVLVDFNEGKTYTMEEWIDKTGNVQ